MDPSLTNCGEVRSGSIGPLRRGALATLVALVALALHAGGAAAGTPGCDQTILGNAGEIRPESSGMSCRRIKEMVTSVSPGPQPYLFESPFTGKYWKCLAPGNRSAEPLLRCELKSKRFSIVSAR
jgi:hypothetical protein